MSSQPTDDGTSTRRRRGPWVVGLVALLGGLWFFLTDTYREEEKELRTQLRETVKEKFPEEASAFSRGFGLVPFDPDRPAPPGGVASRGTVVLIHGLDDPGKVWRSLAPELQAQGFDVWLMRYPNDQPVAESAALLFEELEGLRRRGVERISLVGHSMGGLVAREMLTNPVTGYPTSVREGDVPEVATLVMVGTPNHGSPLARFRGLAEPRDQLARLTKGEASWLSGILDGAGEAKIDLLPDSRFLNELNSRPNPEGVDMLIIAGVVSPWTEGQIEQWIDGLREDANVDQTRRLNELAATLISLTHGLGDGLVSVESTRIPGVDHQTVDGTHLTMIRNFMAKNERIPPAVPIIVHRLTEESR
ncbi:MAG: alpha/beta fold hydrolase [Acidobacteria bacterium]|jgi:pimeloyl-ACP methyl ester carboxylesterase|nr:alpha/beta fold hydrolase [Acidobacteriota bacterium]